MSVLSQPSDLDAGLDAGLDSGLDTGLDTGPGPDARHDHRLPGVEPGSMLLVHRPHGPATEHPALLTAVSDATVLHGWQQADVTSAALAVLDSGLLMQVRAAVEIAARTTDRTAPGTAALCGLARTVLTRFPLSLALRSAVVARAGLVSARPGAGLPVPVREALHLVATLGEQAPGAAAVVAPLFLKPRLLRVGEALALTRGVPLVPVCGRVLLQPAEGDQVVGCPPGRVSTGVEHFASVLTTATAGATGGTASGVHR